MATVAVDRGRHALAQIAFKGIPTQGGQFFMNMRINEPGADGFAARVNHHAGLAVYMRGDPRDLSIADAKFRENSRVACSINYKAVDDLGIKAFHAHSLLCYS